MHVLKGHLILFFSGEIFDSLIRLKVIFDKMDISFFKNQKKKGDADFVYDVQEDFKQEAGASGWDSEEDLDASTSGDANGKE